MLSVKFEIGSAISDHRTLYPPYQSMYMSYKDVKMLVVYFFYSKLSVVCVENMFEINTQFIAYNKAFRHVETLFVQGNQVRTESKQTSLFGNKKIS